jgi:hypothetical protein
VPRILEHVDAIGQQALERSSGGSALGWIAAAALAGLAVGLLLGG